MRRWKPIFKHPYKKGKQPASKSGPQSPTLKQTMSSYKERFSDLASRAGEKSTQSFSKLLRGTSEASKSAYSATSHKWNVWTADSTVTNKYATEERAVLGEPVEFKGGLGCRYCNQAFDWTRRKHHCRNCGYSFCVEHSAYSDYVPAYGYAFAVRTCEACHKELFKQSYEQRINWRIARVESYLQGSLEPFEDKAEDTPRNKAMRGAYFTLQTARYLPYTKQVARATDFVIKHGGLSLTQLLLESEITEAAALIRQLAGSINQEISMTDMVGGLYYLGTQRRWERGNDPEAEHREHQDCPPISPEVLRHCQELAPHALKIAYKTTEVDIQRLLSHIGYELLFAATTSSEFKPAHYVAVNRTKKKAVLAVRGTDGLTDVLTDLCIEGMTWPLVLDLDLSLSEQVKSAKPNTGASNATMVHKGMATAAAWMYQEVNAVIQRLTKDGYSLEVTGHSLGGGVAALLTKIFAEECTPTVKGVVYAAPPVATKDLVPAFDELVTSVVLHDDIVPRASNRTAFVLIEELLKFREDWKPMWEQDIAAHQRRVKEVWAPKTRAGAAIRNSYIASKATLNEMAANAEPPERPLEHPAHIPTHPVPHAVPESIPENNGTEGSAVPSPHAPPHATPYGVPEFTPANTGIEESAALSDSEVHETESLTDNIKATTLPPPTEPAPGKPIPSLFSPGKLIHIYYQRGMFKASHIPVDHPTMMRVELYANMVSDHLSASYYRALHNLHLYGKPESSLNWELYKDVEECGLCHSDFTWNCTSNSQAQQSLARFNCRQCGKLVCDDCSLDREPLPQFGMLEPQRLCDKCVLTSGQPI